jgi:hypothetical protein
MMKIAPVLILALAACTAEAPAPRPQARGEAGVEELASPAPEGAQPFLFAGRDSVLLSWLEPIPGGQFFALRFSRYRDGSWSAPKTIVQRDDLFVNWADFPSIVEDEKGTLFAHWLQKSGAGTYAYDVRMATSSDGGSTWSEPFLLNRDGKQAEHGFVSLAPLPGGGVGATWLDGRNMTAGDGHEEGHDAGDMTIRYAAVDASGAISSDVELDPRTCECCATGMAIPTSGPVIVYRDRSSDEIRDISYVRSTPAGWSIPAPVREDGWKIAGCPVNGPQIDASGDRLAIAWFTEGDQQPRTYLSFSDDGGATLSNPIVVDDGKPAGRVDVLMLGRDAALVTWLEQTTAGAELRARRVTPTGVEPSMKIADTMSARGTGFARIARSGPDVFFAWTEQTASGKKVRVARRRI